MICIARRFGAPVIEPPGKVAASSAAEADVGAQAPAHGRDEVVHGRQRDDPRQRRHLDAARAADAPQIVALEVDDHDVLGAILRRGEELGGGRAIGVGIGAARPRPLDGPGLDGAVGVERKEALGRVAQDRQCVGGGVVAVASPGEKSACGAGAAARSAAARAVGSPGVDGRAQPPRQVDLIGVARLQVARGSAATPSRNGASGWSGASGPRRARPGARPRAPADAASRVGRAPRRARRCAPRRSASRTQTASWK